MENMLYLLLDGMDDKFLCYKAEVDSSFFDENMNSGESVCGSREDIEREMIEKRACMDGIPRYFMQA